MAFLLKIKEGLQSWDPRRRSGEFRSSLRNAVYSSLDHATVPILWLVATPIFVSGLGLDQFGVFTLAYALLGFSGVMGFGVGEATVKFVAGYETRNDKAGLERTIRSSITVAALLGLVTGAGMVFLAPYLAENVFKIDEKNVSLTITAFQIAGVGIVARFFDNVFQSVIYGFQRYDLAARVSMVANGATIVVNMGLVLAGFGLVEILWVTVAFIAASALAKAVLVRRALKWQGGLRPMFSLMALREIFGFGFFSWLQSLGGFLLSHLDRFLIASMLGTTQLAYYAVCLQLAQQIHALPARTMGFVYPMASSVKETGDIGRLRRIYFAGLNLTSVAAVALGAPIFVFSESILQLWIGPEFAANSANTLRVLVIAFSILATSIIPTYYLNGTGYVRFATGMSLASGTTIGIAAYFLIPFLGIPGAALSRLANTPISLISRMFVHYRVLNDKRWYAGAMIFVPVLIPYIVAGMGLWVFGVPNLRLLVLVPWAVAVAVLGTAIARALVLLCNSPRLPAEGVSARTPCEMT